MHNEEHNNQDNKSNNNNNESSQVYPPRQSNTGLAANIPPSNTFYPPSNQYRGNPGAPGIPYAYMVDPTMIQVSYEQYCFQLQFQIQQLRNELIVQQQNLEEVHNELDEERNKREEAETHLEREVQHSEQLQKRADELVKKK